jgi:hypothetical protein
MPPTRVPEPPPPPHPVTYGASALETFGATAALVSFAPRELRARVAASSALLLGIADQRHAPICCAVAAPTLLALAAHRRGFPPPSCDPVYVFAAARRVVRARDPGLVAVAAQEHAGVPLGAALQALCDWGCVPELVPGDSVARWPLDDADFGALAAQAASLPWRCRAFRLYPSLEQIRLALAGGHGVAVALRIDAAMDVWMRQRDLQGGSDYELPRPSLFGQPVAAHACVIVGADDERRRVRLRNSFGPDWGDAGHFYVAYDALLLTRFTGNEFFVLD